MVREGELYVSVCRVLECGPKVVYLSEGRREICHHEVSPTDSHLSLIFSHDVGHAVRLREFSETDTHIPCPCIESLRDADDRKLLEQHFRNFRS